MIGHLFIGHHFIGDLYRGHNRPSFYRPPTYTLAHDQLIKKPEQLFVFFAGTCKPLKTKEKKRLFAMIACGIE